MFLVFTKLVEISAILDIQLHKSDISAILDILRELVIFCWKY